MRGYYYKLTNLSCLIN